MTDADEGHTEPAPAAAVTLKGVAATGAVGASIAESVGVATASKSKAVAPPPVPPALPPFGGMDDATNTIIQEIGLARHKFTAATASDNFSNTPLPLRVEPVPQARNAIKDAGLSPPSENSSFDTARFDKATFDGAGTVRADAILVPATANLSLSTSAPTVVIERRLSERPKETGETLHALANEIRKEIDRLNQNKPNADDGLARHNEYVAFLEMIADGFASIVDILKSSSTVGKSEPVFLGRPGEIVKQLNIGVDEFLEQHRAHVIGVGAVGLSVLLLKAFGVESEGVWQFVAGTLLGYGGSKLTPKQ